VLRDSRQFIRVVYDDSDWLPWIIVWGEDNVWLRCRTRDLALEKSKELQDVCDVFHAWMQA